MAVGRGLDGSVQALGLDPIAGFQIEDIGHHVLSIEMKVVERLESPGSQLPVCPLIVDLGTDFDPLVTAGEQLIEEHLVDVAGDALAAQLGGKAAEE